MQLLLLYLLMIVTMSITIIIRKDILIMILKIIIPHLLMMYMKNIKMFIIIMQTNTQIINPPLLIQIQEKIILITIKPLLIELHLLVIVMKIKHKNMFIKNYQIFLNCNYLYYLVLYMLSL